MNEKVIKNLLRQGLCIHHSNEYIAIPLLPNTDLTLHKFYMLGRAIVNKDDYTKVGILPKIMYVPPEIDADIDDYWSVAVCVGPIEGCDGYTMVPFSYRPWKLRTHIFTSIQEQLYTLALISSSMRVPKDVLKVIFFHLKTETDKLKENYDKFREVIL